MRHPHQYATRVRASALLFVPVALMLGLAGCGDDDDDIDVGADEETTTTTEADGAGGVGSLEASLASLNGSGGNGNATVELEDGQVTVTVNAERVSAGLPHAQHIHIGGTNVCPPASAGEMSEPKNLIDTAEGQPSYGAVKVSLTTEGDVGEGSALAVPRFPSADDDGSYTYTRTFDLPEGTTAEDVRNGVIVVHGISKLFGDEAKYDGDPKSSLDPTLPLEATIPTLCGKLQPS